MEKSLVKEMKKCPKEKNVVDEEKTNEFSLL